ncbi:ABC transporter permease [Pengzhenrongella sp.]|jgi:ABC-type transport system involved in multi-copper enzyme maturation permease subunit|uniref:ABC transporter permease n=1 Tax=Pengzhenrongella sp. TaxID=2888820 RepID=UPI002F932F97
MNLSAVRAVAGWEFRLAVRGRLVVGSAVTFAIVCVVATLLGLRSLSDLGLAGVGPGTAALINLAILFPPLMGILLGANSVASARERGLLPLMLVQPMSRLDHVTGVIVGLVGAVWLTIGVGLGASALLLAGVAGTADVGGLLAIVVAALGVGMVSVALGVAISALAGSRLAALGLSMGAWFLFAFAIDLVLAGVASGVHLGSFGLFVGVLFNPLEAGRVLMVLASGADALTLGPFGAYLNVTVGTTGAALAVCGSLAAWTVASLVAAWAGVTRREP